MASLIGGRELCDAMGLDWDSLADRQKVAVFLNRHHVPFVSIGSNRRGNAYRGNTQRGLLIDAEALHSIIWKRHEDRTRRKQAPIGASDTVLGGGRLSDGLDHAE